MDMFFRDKAGRQTIWQTPNIPLLGWVVFTVLAYVTSGRFQAGLQYFARVWLFTWAYLEITTGTSYFRRTLGAVVMILLMLAILGLQRP